MYTRCMTFFFTHNGSLLNYRRNLSSLVFNVHTGHDNIHFITHICILLNYRRNLTSLVLNVHTGHDDLYFIKKTLSNKFWKKFDILNVYTGHDDLHLITNIYFIKLSKKLDIAGLECTVLHKEYIIQIAVKVFRSVEARSSSSDIQRTSILGDFTSDVRLREKRVTVNY